MTARKVGAASVALNWTKAVDSQFDIVANYRIYKDVAVFDTVPGWSGEHYTVTGLSPATTYRFKVEAGDSFGQWTADGPSLTVATVAETPEYDFALSIAPIYVQVSNQNAVGGYANVTLTGLGGFFDLINMAATVSSSTIGGPVPRAGFTATSVFLGEIRNVELFQINVVANGVPAGTYTLTVTGTWAERSHSAATTIEVVATATVSRVYFLYELRYTGSPTPGSTIMFRNNFTATGVSQVRINTVRYSWDLGALQPNTSGLPFTLGPVERRELDVAVTIPTSASIGKHSISATLEWDYYEGTWLVGDPVIVNGSLMIVGSQNLPFPANSVFGTLRNIMRSPALSIILGVYGLLTGTASILFIRHESAKRKARILC